MRVKLQAIKQELRRNMHQPVPQQGRWLQQVITGCFNYHAVPASSSGFDRVPHSTSPQSLAAHADSGARKTGRPGERIKRLAGHFAPQAADPSSVARDSLRHSRHPRREPCARVGLARICARRARGNSRPYRESGSSGLSRAAFDPKRTFEAPEASAKPHFRC